MPNYFIGVVSREHVKYGVKLGIAQIGHGKKAGLARMRKGDWLIYYSPKIALESTEPLQAFTALGQIADDTIVQVEESPAFKPYRRKVNYEKVREIPIRPLIEDLSFIQNKRSWGYAFRFGLIEIPETDFNAIAIHMRGEKKASMTSSAIFIPQLWFRAVELRDCVTSTHNYILPNLSSPQN